MKWTIENCAYVAQEWAGGVSQRTLGNRYGYTIPLVSNRISDFILAVFPECGEPGHRSYTGQMRMRVTVYDDAKRALVRRALDSWDGKLIEPAYRGGNGPADMWPEFVLPLDNVPDIAA
jgi:hypothetical protein